MSSSVSTKKINWTVASTLLGATVFATPITAMADVQLYGEINATVEKQRLSDTEIHSVGSYVGIKGVEDLGATDVIWQYEQGLSVGDSENRKYNFKENVRETYIGLRHDNLGSLTIGKQEMPYAKIANKVNNHKHKTITNFGKFGRSKPFNNGSVIYRTNEKREQYTGLRGSIGFATERENDSLTERSKKYSGALEFKPYPVGVDVNIAYERQEDIIVNNDKQDLYIVTAGYELDNHVRFNVGYEVANYNDRVGNKKSQKTVSVTTTVPVHERVDLLGTYTHNFKTKENGVKVNDKRGTYTFATKYKMSERTEIEGFYSYERFSKTTRTSFSSQHNKNLYTYGMSLNHKF